MPQVGSGYREGQLVQQRADRVGAREEVERVLQRRELLLEVGKERGENVTQYLQC